MFGNRATEPTTQMPFSSAGQALCSTADGRRGRRGFLDAPRALRDGLEALGVPWMIIGGVAVIAHGVPRYTADVDATVSAPDEPLDTLGWFDEDRSLRSTAVSSR